MDSHGTAALQFPWYQNRRARVLLGPECSPRFGDHTAIHCQGVTTDIITGARTQEDCRTSSILGLSQAPGWYSPSHRLLMGQHMAGHLAGEKARCNTVDIDVLGTQVRRHMSRQLNDGGLTGRVGIVIHARVGDAVDG